MLRTLIFASTLLLSAAANGQGTLFRAYLASDGNDANPCTLPSPCRLLPAALDAVMSGGEIWMLDSANYNTTTVVVGKSVSILAVPGAVGSVVAGAGQAISITASGLKVALRNLVIVPLPGAGTAVGVDMSGASTLTIEGGLIANHMNIAVRSTGAGRLSIIDTTIRGNGSAAILIEGGGQADIVRTQMLHNGDGGVYIRNFTGSTTQLSIVDSVISGGMEGIITHASGSGSVARAYITRCTIRNTTYALDLIAVGGGAATQSLGSSTIVGNVNAWWNPGSGILRTLGNNQITDNETSNGSLTPTLLQ